MLLEILNFLLESSYENSVRLLVKLFLFGACEFKVFKSHHTIFFFHFGNRIHVVYPIKHFNAYLSSLKALCNLVALCYLLVSSSLTKRKFAV